MTVASDVRKSGPYVGDDVNTSFTYAFKIYDSSHIRVVHTSALGVETTLTEGVDYTVNNVGEDPPGNTIDYPVSGSPLPATEKLTLVRNVPFTQDTDLNNEGGYYPETVETMVDLNLMRLQQLDEEVERSVKVDVSSSDSPDTLMDTLIASTADAEQAKADAEAALAQMQSIFYTLDDAGATASAATDNSAVINTALASYARVYVPANKIYGYNSGTVTDISRMTGPGLLYDQATDELVALDQIVGNALSHSNRAGGVVISGGYFDLANSGIPSANAAVFSPYGVKWWQQESGWQFVDTLRGGSPNVIEVRTGAVKGEFTTASGTDELTLVSGSGIQGFLVGLPMVITYKHRASQLVKVASIDVGLGKLTVTDIDGGPISFASSETAYCFWTNVLNHIEVTISGTTCYLLKNEAYETPQFVFDGYALTNKHVYILIAGTAYRVTAVDVNPDSSLYHQVLTLASAPANATYDATLSHYWETPVRIRAKGTHSALDEGGMSMVLDHNGYKLMTKAKTTDLQRPLLVGSNDCANSLFFSADTNKAIHVCDTDDFFGVVDPTLTSRGGLTDLFKFNITRDAASAHTPGGTVRANIMRVGGNHGGTSGSIRMLEVFSYNDSEGPILQATLPGGYTSLRLNPNGGKTLIGIKETADGELFQVGSTSLFKDNITVQKSSSPTIWLEETTGSTGGRVIAGTNSVSLRGGLAGFGTDLTVSANNNKISFTSQGTLIGEAYWDGAKTIVRWFTLPTSSAGLPTETVWNNSGVLNVT